MRSEARNILLATIVMACFATPDVARAEAHYGFESNVPTFFLNGYHGSFWYGNNGQRVRLVSAKAVYPHGQTEAGFRDKTLTFLEIELDFFFGEHADEFRGFWLASGIGRTRQEVTSEATGTKFSIGTNDFHFGAGYVFEVATRVTLNPWIGGDYHLNSPSTVFAGSETWNPRKLELVGGIKLGIDF